VQERPYHRAAVVTSVNEDRVLSSETHRDSLPTSVCFATHSGRRQRRGVSTLGDLQSTHEQQLCKGVVIGLIENHPTQIKRT